MACWTIDGGKGQVCFADSVTEVAFGPLFESVEDAEAFSKWLGTDPRRFSTAELIEKKHRWHRGDKA